jgi:uracil-DNA glycosylase
MNIKSDIVFINVSDTVTANNRSLTVREIKSNLQALEQKIKCIRPTHIVAIGKAADRALTLLQLHFYTMPHPSGRNRVCNDGRFIAEKIKGLELFVLGPNNANKAQ